MNKPDYIPQETANLLDLEVLETQPGVPVPPDGWQFSIPEDNGNSGYEVTIVGTEDFRVEDTDDNSIHYYSVDQMRHLIAIARYAQAAQVARYAQAAQGWDLGL